MDSKRNLKIPKFEIVEMKQDSIKFLVFDCDVGFVTSLRRVMIAEVPTMAIEIVSVQNNSSLTHDEFLAHRLGLVPLDSNLVDEFLYTKDCDCEENCNKCSVGFTLNVTHNPHSDVTHVLSTDLVSSDTRIQPVDTILRQKPNTNNSQTEKLYPPAIITKLGKGQTVQVNAIAKKGIGKENAKWSPVSVAAFKYEPDVRIDQKVASSIPPKQLDSIASACPSKVFAFDNNNNKLTVNDSNACTYCHECMNLADEFGASGLINITKKQDRFIFTLETTGVMNPSLVIQTAIKILQEKIRVIQCGLPPLTSAKL